MNQQPAPGPRRQHHQAHDALAIDLLAILLDKDFAVKPVCGLHEQGGGSGMDALPVQHDKFFRDLHIIHFAGTAHFPGTVTAVLASCQCNYSFPKACASGLVNAPGMPYRSPVSSNAESELLARCCKGESDAWDALFDLHYGPASRFIFQLGHDFSREDVEEICQEVFVTVIKNLHTFLGHSQFQTWLFRIAANKARDYRQKLHAAKRGGGQVTVPLSTAPHDDADTAYTVDPASPMPGPDLALLQSEKLALVGQALESLGGPCQEIIELRYFADLSYEEIAKSLELNPKTVS